MTVVSDPDGRSAIRHRGVDLPFRPFDKLQQVDQAAIVENKRLGAALAHIRERQATYGPAWNRAHRDRRHTANNLLRPGLPSG